MFAKRILIFERSLATHHLEYFHHLYIAACEQKNYFFVFAMPDSFHIKSKLLEWPQSENIEMFFFPDESTIYQSALCRSFFLTRFLNKLVKEYSITDIFLIELMAYMPFLPFLINKKIRISGVIYKIYLYTWKDSTLLKKIQDVFKYILFSKISIFKNIFVLNDKASTYYLNRRYKTCCFKYLPDPYIPFHGGFILDLKSKLGIKNKKKVLLHFGALCDLKGTLTILDAIDYMCEDELREYIFIFAGRLFVDIEKVFRYRVDILKNKCEIIFLEGFQSYEMLASLCIISDTILMPYKRTSQSSGGLSYAAQFRKPVIAPAKGLLGKLVRKNKLGILIKNVNGESLAKAISNANEWKYTSDSYLKNNDVKNFQRIIMSNL